MQDTEIALLRRILLGQSVLTLAVIDGSAPVAGQLPYALEPDFSALLVHASKLARHSRGLFEGASYSALIQAPESDELDPFQRPRVSFEGSARQLSRDTPQWQTGKRIYLERLPSGAITFELGDFTLYRLVIEKGRFVSGFAGAHTLNPAILAELAT